MSFQGRVHSAIFHRRNQFRFPGNGRMSGGHQPTKNEDSQPVQHTGTTAECLSAQNFTGEFTDLLNDPAYDQRATALPAAKEEA